MIALGLLMILLGWWLAWPAPAATTVQYDSTTGEVTAAPQGPINPDTGHVEGVPLNVLNRTLVTFPGAVTWPAVPGAVPDGCPTGQWEWTRVLDPANPASITAAGGGLGLVTPLHVFRTTSTFLPGCHRVFEAADIDQLLSDTVIAEVSKHRLTIALNHMQVPSLTRCPTGNNTAPCTSVRTKRDTWANFYPDATQLDNFFTQANLLRDHVQTFKNSREW